MKRYVCSLFLILFIGTAQSADWTQWRGPNGNHTTDDANWTADALKDGAKILWRTNVGWGHSTISILDGRCYTMGERRDIQGADTTFTESVICLDAKSGKKIWEYPYPANHGRYPGPGATPLVLTDRLYTQTRGGTILCIKPNDGSVIWKTDLAAKGLTEPTPWGCCSSPVLSGEILLINAGKSGVALNKDTGALIWKSECDVSGHATPLIFEKEGSKQAAIIGENIFSIVEVNTGKVLASQDWNADMDPLLLEDRFYLSGAHGRGKGSVMLQWADNLTPLWETRNTTHAFQPPIVHKGYAYVYNFKNRRSQPFECINLETGEVAWTQDLGFWGAAIGSQGKLLIVTGQGDLVVAKSDPGLYKEIARANLFKLEQYEKYPDGLPHCVWTAPVLVDGRLYARTTYGELVCVDLTQ